MGRNHFVVTVVVVFVMHLIVVVAYNQNLHKHRENPLEADRQEVSTQARKGGFLSENFNTHKPGLI